VQVVVVVAVCAVKGAWSYLTTGLGLLAASTGVGLAVAALVSVLAPYALPQSENPFATNTGSGSVKGLLAVAALAATLLLSSPVSIAAVLLHTPAWGGVILAVGVTYGVLAVRLGTSIAGDVLDRRLPEILVSVTPRR
jgi:ABC-2 type transport system permease protein